MWKTVLAGSTALAIAGATLAYAQQGPGGRDFAQRWQPSAEDIGAFGDARIAAVHAGLKLSAEQEKNWPAVESALRDLAKQRSERFAARASADRPKDPVERLALRADVMTQRGAALKKLADAAGPLYKSLDEGQKHRFVMLARLGGRQFGGERGRHGHRGRRLDASRSRRVRARSDATRRWPAAAVKPRLRVVAGGGRCGLPDAVKPPSPEAAGLARRLFVTSRMIISGNRSHPDQVEDKLFGIMRLVRALPRPRGWTLRHRFAKSRAPGGAPRRRQSGRIAQLVEQLTLNQRVTGSSPVAPTNHYQQLSFDFRTSGQRHIEPGQRLGQQTPAAPRRRRARKSLAAS